MQRICVIGSLNVDLTITIPRFHEAGETIPGTSFATFTGGKGGNQAVALGRLGADVSMVGRLGADANGGLYRRTLLAERVDDRFVADCDTPTGVALIEVNAATGDNRIAVYMGANDRLDTAYLEGLWPQLRDFDIFLMQFEMPMDAVRFVAGKIREAGKILILDPAPAQTVDRALLACATYVTPNETELKLLTGMPTGSPEQIEAAARALRGQGAQAVIAKMGAQGALLLDGDRAERVPGFPVRAIDTTAAGDSFNAGFAMALSEGKAPAEAIRFANAVGGLATTAMGAQGAMPSMADALALINAASGY